jgi:hypothetical protein
MDLEAARKFLSKKRRAFSAKKIAFGITAGLVLVAGIALRASHYFGEAPAENKPAAVEAAAPAPEAGSPPPAQTSKSVPMTPPVTQEAAPAPEVASPHPAETPVSVPELPPATQQSAPAPSGPAQQAGDAVEQAEPAGDAIGEPEQAELPGSGMILVSRKPVEVLASPSASAPAMFGFPAGRPFRVIGREGGFVQIKDLRSSATGWIDEAALAMPPPRAPAVAAPSPSKPGAGNRKPATAAANPKPKSAKKNAPVTADSERVAEPESAQARRPPGLFGRGGFFGGVFGGGNAN